MFTIFKRFAYAPFLTNFNARLTRDFIEIIEDNFNDNWDEKLTRNRSLIVKTFQAYTKISINFK